MAISPANAHTQTAPSFTAAAGNASIAYGARACSASFSSSVTVESSRVCSRVSLSPKNSAQPAALAFVVIATTIETSATSCRGVGGGFVVGVDGSGAPGCGDGAYLRSDGACSTDPAARMESARSTSCKGSFSSRAMSSALSPAAALARSLSPSFRVSLRRCKVVGCGIPRDGSGSVAATAS
jgi:hypothetical protein